MVVLRSKVAVIGAVVALAVTGVAAGLIAAVRSKPYQAYSYSIDPGSGTLKLVGTGPLAESTRLGTWEVMLGGGAPT